MTWLDGMVGSAVFTIIIVAIVNFTACHRYEACMEKTRDTAACGKP